MKQSEMSSIDAYLNRAFKIIVVLPLTGATTSAFVFTIFRLLGWWPDIPARLLAVYDIINILYFTIAIYLSRTCKDEYGSIRPDKIKQGKRFVGFIVVAQWNFISYMIPDREWWAYLFFFIALTIVFFDIKFTSIISFLLTASTVISWIVHGNYMFLSSSDPLFYPTLVLRLFCIGLTILTMLFITYFGGKYLVEELERHANYDPLTNLLNRRSMGQYMKNACEKVEHGKDAQAALEAADAKLYYGKRHGKNCVVTQL